MGLEESISEIEAKLFANSAQVEQDKTYEQELKKECLDIYCKKIDCEGSEEAEIIEKPPSKFIIMPPREDLHKIIFNLAHQKLIKNKTNSKIL